MTSPIFRPENKRLFGRFAVAALFLVSLFALHFQLPHKSISELDTANLILIATFGLLSGASFITLMVIAVRLHKSETRAAEAESHLKAAIDNISEGFVIYDADERFVMCNQRYKDMYPTIADQMAPGTAFSDLTDGLISSPSLPADVESIADWREMRLKQFRSDTGEFIAQYGDGRWVLSRDRTLPDGGKVGIRTDITDLKEREQKLQASERRQRDLVERAPVAIFVHRNQIIIYANAMTAQMLGYDSSVQLLGKNIFELIHPNHHRMAENRLEKLRHNAEPLPQVDMKFIRADDSEIYTEAQMSKIMFDGKPALESILSDITSRRRTERALMESEMRYRTLFELAPDAMVVHDGHTILFANAAAAVMFGRNDERGLIGTELVDLLSASSDEGALTSISSWHYGDVGPVAISEARFLRADDGIFDAEIVTAPTNYHGEVVYHAVIRDVTHRKMMDATLAQNSKLASLGGMAAGLAHELSQPLNIMRFAAEGGLLKMKRGNANDDLHAKNYQLIQDQSERMGAIMDSMRIFSRKDPGPMQAFDIALSVRDITHLLRNPFRVDGVDVQIHAPVSGIKVIGNPIQLEQVLLNLLKNARDAIIENQARTGHPQSGLIEVECRPRLERGDAIIAISDNGGGIAPENMRQIFDPFFTTKDVGQGTGLGLSLSHEIIVSMSGTLNAETTGQGARFTITLPLSNETIANDANDPALIEEPAAQVRPQPVRKTDGLHILVVEDEIEAARAMADYLREDGFRVTTVNNGLEGLEAYKSETPDVVVTDIRMPGFSGTDLIREIRQDNPTIPIIAVTGHMGETENIDPGLGGLPIDVLKKPVSLMDLSRRIGKLIAA